MENSLFPLTFSGVGITIVFAVLALIATVISVLRNFDDRWEQKERQAEIDRLNEEPSIDATTLVLISAAVATAVEGRHYIKSVRRVAPKGIRRGTWALQGRAVLHGSHTVKPNHRR